MALAARDQVRRDFELQIAGRWRVSDWSGGWEREVCTFVGLGDGGKDC
jgi:hypothetical protein